MKIAELKPNQGRIDLEAEVVEVGEVRSFIRFGRAIRVANATIKDDSGTTQLTLWNGEIDKVKAGSKVKITNGYAKEFQGEITVTAGKFGKIEVDGEPATEERPGREQPQEQEQAAEEPEEESEEKAEEASSDEEVKE